MLGVLPARTAQGQVFNEAISREFSVLNAADEQPIFSEAISREFSVLLTFNEALSREFSVLNTAEEPIVFTEAISREWSTLNTAEEQIVFTEANSREFSVVAGDAVLLAASSKKTHGSAGGFEIDLLGPLSNYAVAVEDRTAGPTQVVVTFNEAIQRYGSPGDVVVTGTGASPGTISNLAISGPELTINMAGASDASRLRFAFPGIVDLEGHSGPDTFCFGTLLGDANGDGSANIFDLVTMRNVLNTGATAVTFRMDVNADGAINIFDLVMTRNNLNKALAAACP